jgi:Fur family iron response transcriptional regulator
MKRLRPQGMTPAEIEQRLLERNVQPTAQRIAICRYVLCEADHPTADDVKRWTDKNFPKLSLATVYNTLGTLVRAGLLREFRFPHSEKVVYDSNVDDHYHFLDEETGKLFDLGREHVDVRAHAAAPEGYRVDTIEVVVRGRRARK